MNDPHPHKHHTSSAFVVVYVIGFFMGLFTGIFGGPVIERYFGTGSCAPESAPAVSPPPTPSGR